MKITVRAVTENLISVTEFVNSVLDAAECSPKARMQIDVAVDEIFSNVVNYAYTPQSGDISVAITVEKEPLTAVLTFEDRGRRFDPLNTAEPDISLSAEERDVGGLGIFMVKKTMDDIDYQYKD